MSPLKFTLRAESPSIFLDKSGLTVDLSRKIEGDSARMVYRTVHVWYEQKLRLWLASSHVHRTFIVPHLTHFPVFFSVLNSFYPDIRYISLDAVSFSKLYRFTVRCPLPDKIKRPLDLPKRTSTAIRASSTELQLFPVAD